MIVAAPQQPVIVVRHVKSVQKLVVGLQPLVHEKAVEKEFPAIRHAEPQEIQTLADMLGNPSLVQCRAALAQRVQHVRRHPMRSPVRQHRNPVREVLRPLHHLEDVVAHAHDRQVLVHVQMTVASDAQVPAPAVAGEAVDQ